MTLLRQSPLHETLHEEHTRARWGKACGMQVALHLNDLAKETELANTLALADASFLPRVVLKGSGAAAYFQTLGTTIPEEILQVGSLAGGGLIARTGGSEFFLESGPVGRPFWAVPDWLSSQNGSEGPFYCYPVLRQDASLIISGSRASEMFRQVSSYDFIGEVHNNIVFTPIAGVSCSVLRTNINGRSVFRLWTDGTYGHYIWHKLLEVAKELGGGAVGAAVFYPELSSEANQR